LRPIALALALSFALTTQACAGRTIHGLDEEAWMTLLANGEPLPLGPGEAVDFDALARLGPGASLSIAMRALESGQPDIAVAALGDSLRRDTGRMRARAAALLGETLLAAGDGQGLLALCRSEAGTALEPARRAYLELRGLAFKARQAETLAAIQAYRRDYPTEARGAAPELAALAFAAGLESDLGASAQELAALVAMGSSPAVHAALASSVAAVSVLGRERASEAIEAAGPRTFQRAEARALTGTRDFGPAVVAFRRYASGNEEAASIASRLCAPHELVPPSLAATVEEPLLPPSPPSPPSFAAPLSPKAGGSLILALDRAAASDAARALLAASRDEGAEAFRWIVETSTRREPDAARDYFAYFWHGRFLREAERWGAAQAAFAKAAELASTNADRDAARWYDVEAVWKRAPTEAVSALAAAIAETSNPAYYSDLLEPISREALIRRDGAGLARLDAGVLTRATAKDRARLAYLCARAAQQGIIGERQLRAAFGDAAPARDEYATTRLRIAYDQVADPWYRLLAAYRLGLPLVEPLIEEPIATSGSATSGSATSGSATSGSATVVKRPAGAVSEAEERAKKEAEELEAFAEALSRFGLGHRLRLELGSDFSRLSPEAVRRAAERLRDAGRPDRAYRLIATQFWKAAFRPSRPDAELYWPRPYLGLFTEAARRNDIDLHLLYGLARSESAFDKDAVSRSGAVGLTQLMPATAAETAARLKMSDYDLRDPADNLTMGSYYLARLLGGAVSAGRVLPALFSYNGGPTRFRRWEADAGALPMDLLLETLGFAETRQYGRNVVHASVHYAMLYGEVDLRAYLAYALGEGPRP